MAGSVGSGWRPREMVICGRLGAGMAERKERIALASLVSAGEGIDRLGESFSMGKGRSAVAG